MALADGLTVFETNQPSAGAYRPLRKVRAVMINKKALFLGLGAMTLAATTAKAQLFIYPPDFSGTPVVGSEPGIGLPLPGATPAELKASLIWNLRAGLNVAALQCQFSPILGTVRNYNQLLRHQAAELNRARLDMESYFKRTDGKDGPRAFDLYTTRTYNGFSTLHAQLGFCQTAGNLGRGALGTAKGALGDYASQHMREFRNSLVPAGDRVFSMSYRYFPVEQLTDPCVDKRGQRKKRC